MLLQTNSYIVPAERRADHARLIRRFRQAMSRIGCDQFEVYEQVGPNWSPGSTGRYVQIMRFRDRQHQQAVQAAERNDPGSQQIIAEFCDLINFPYQQQHGYFATSFYASVLPVGPRQLLEFPQEDAVAVDEVSPATEEGEYQEVGEEVEAAEDVTAGEQAAVEADELTAVELGELPDAEVEEVAPIESEELSAAEAEELAPVESKELPAAEANELTPIESDELLAAEAEELAPVEAEALPDAEADELSPIGFSESAEAELDEPSPVESEELSADEGDELSPLGLEKAPASEIDELAPVESNELPEVEADELEPVEFEELPLEVDEAPEAQLDELIPAEEEKPEAGASHDLTPAEAAAIAAGEMLPDDVESPPTVGENTDGGLPLEAHDESLEEEVVAKEDTSFASFIDSLTQEDLEAHENVVQEADLRPRGGATAESVSEANFADGAIPAEYENDLVTADAFSPAETAPEGDVEEDTESLLAAVEGEETGEDELPAELASLDETGDSLVDRLTGLEAEDLVDDPAHERAAMLQDEFDPGRAIAEGPGHGFEVEPSIGHSQHLAEDPSASDAASGKEEPMIEFETFLRELENPAADPGRRAH